MLSELRHKHIEDYLKEVEFASLEELSDKLAVSVSTVRRDLTQIEEKGVVRRTHGGARLIDQKKDDYVFTTRQEVERESKVAVAKACTELIAPNQSLFMDGGSTVFTVAQHLEAKAPHIVTNSLPIANFYSSHRDVEVIVSGGVIYPRLQVMVGELALRCYQSLNADIAILGGGGATKEGVMNSHTLLIEIQRAMIASAQKVIVCLDHSKIGRQSFTPLCNWDAVDVLVTNRQAPKDLLSHIRKQKVDVFLA